MDSLPATTEQQISTVKAEIKAVVQSFLQRCDIPWPQPSTLIYDTDLDNLTREECIRRNIPLSGSRSAAPFIPAAVNLTRHCYAHLKNPKTIAFIALITALMFYADDSFVRDVAGVRCFHARFARGETLEDPALEGFAQCLRELPDHFDAVVANMVLTGMLNLLNSLLLDYETHGMALHRRADKYPYFSRCMNGAAEAYGAFAFGRDTRLKDYIQALPEVMVYINSTNDVLSFYKEELAGESENHVSLLAGVRGTSKIEALARIADNNVDAHKRVQEILNANMDRKSFEEYRAFSCGVVAFHAAARRFKLEDLDL